MAATTVLKLASEEPRLTRFLSAIANIPEYKAHIQVARSLVKCILFLALGPRDDNQLPQEIRAQRRATALQWALSLIDILRRDRIQSEFYFIETPTSSPHPQLGMMTDLGFSSTTLSASIIASLISQITAKINYVDNVIMSKDELIYYWSEKKTAKFSVTKYCSIRHALSLKCVSLIDNGPAILSLIEKIISSPARTQIPNISSFSSSRVVSNLTAGSSNQVPMTECICGISNELIDKLFANGAQHFEKLGSNAKASLLFQCPRTLSLELERCIKNVIARPIAAQSVIQDLNRNIIESSLIYPAIYVHCASILRHLIITSTHPSLIRMYIIISESVHQRLKTANLMKNQFLGRYWSSSLIYILSKEPSSTLQYASLNLEIENLTGSKICSDEEDTRIFGHPRTFTQEIWFTVLSFHHWIRKAYYLAVAVEAPLQKELFKFLAWHAHPMSENARTLAFNCMVDIVPRIKLMFEMTGDEIMQEVSLAPPVVHPFLLYCWTPEEHVPSFTMETVVKYCLRHRTGITLCMILDYFELLLETHSELMANSVPNLLTPIQGELPQAISSNPDVESRLAAMIKRFSP